MSLEDEAGLSFLADNSSDIVCRAGLDLTLHYASPSLLPVLGWEPEEFLGKSLNDFLSAEDAATFASARGSATAPALEKAPVTLRLHSKDGTLLWMELRRRLLLDPATGEPREYIILMRDLEGLRSPAGENSPELFTTRVAGLSTHPEFSRDLDHECGRAYREASPLSLMRLDFNGFRQLHFLDGHRVGDECLAKAAVAVRAVLRLSDFVAQYEAEDMVILLPATDHGGAARVASKVRSAIDALRSPRSLEGQGWAAVSIGVSTMMAQPGSSRRMPEILLLAANHALRNAQREEAESLSHIAAYSAHNADWKKSMPVGGVKLHVSRSLA